MTRKEQYEKRRQDIMTAALDIFIRKGYSGTKIQDIAQTVGMSVGLLFNYFESKENLYEELIKLGKNHPKNMLESIEGEPLEFFRSSARDIIQHVTTNPFVAKMFVFMTKAKGNEAIPESAKKLLADTDSLDLSINILIQGQQNGSIRAGNPVSLALTFWGAIQGIAEQIALNPDFPTPDSEWIVNILRK